MAEAIPGLSAEHERLLRTVGKLEADAEKKNAEGGYFGGAIVDTRMVARNARMSQKDTLRLLNVLASLGFIEKSRRLDYEGASPSEVWLTARGKELLAQFPVIRRGCGSR